MSVTARETPLQTAERALALAAGGELQVTVVHERSLLSRFARSAPTQATEVDDTSVEILAVHDGHTALAATNRLDDDALREAARHADRAARAAAEGGAGTYPALPDPEPAPAPAREPDAREPLDPALAGDALRATFAVAAARGLEAFGAWTTGAVRTAIASTTGTRLDEQVSDAFMKVVCRNAGGRSGYASATATGPDEIDPRIVAGRAAAKVSGEPLAELGPGSYRVVLEPEAVGLLLEFLGELAFNGLAHVEERGALSGRLGTAVAAPSIHLADEPLRPRTLTRGFDLEGVPKAPRRLIADGIGEAVVHDLRSAALAGCGTRSTGHASRPGGSAHGPVPTNLVLGGGAAADVAELCAPIRQGIYVTRLWYVNPVREKETLLTGMTREGTFLIEDGAITRPLRDVRFTDSILRLLAATEALTSKQRLVSGGEFYGRRFASGVLCPALRADGLRVTGATAG